MLCFAREMSYVGLPLGCCALFLFPPLGLAWIWLQVRALRAGDRASWLSLAAIVGIGLLAGFMVFHVARGGHLPRGYDQLVFLPSLGGLLLLPLTLTCEVLKYLRDRSYRPAPPRRKRRRPQRTR